jgi:hypothetical protein
VEYQRVSVSLPPLIEFVGEEDVVFRATNEYTNYTCARRFCRLAVVYRKESGFDCAGGDATFFDGSCIVRRQDSRDDSLGLCHNTSNASVCWVWLPSEHDWTEPEIIASLVLFNLTVVVALAAFALLWWGRLLYPNLMLVPLVWAVALLVMGNTALVSAWEMRSFAAETQVSMDYVSYQACWRYCMTKHGRDKDVAKTAGCNDRVDVSCNGGLDPYCKSCQKAKDEHVKLHEASLVMTVAVCVRAVAFALVLGFKHLWVGIPASALVFGAWIANWVYVGGSAMGGGPRNVAKWAVDFGEEVR